MSLPMSKYEELLETVRSLKDQAIRVRELASPLLDTIINTNTQHIQHPAVASSVHSDPSYDHFDWFEDDTKWRKRRLQQKWHNDIKELYPRTLSTDAMDSMMTDRQPKPSIQPFDEQNPETHSSRQHLSMSSDPDIPPRRVSALYHGTWPVERAMWASEPPSPKQSAQLDVTSVMSFASSSGAAPLEKVLHRDKRSNSQQLEVKVDMVYSLLSMLGTQECPDMGETLLALSSSPDSSLAMRQAGCLPVLVQLVYSDKDKETREKASKAMSNLILVQPDEKLKKREAKLLKQLEQIRSYCDNVADNSDPEDDGNPHPTSITENIIKLSFDEAYRHTICELGGIYALAKLIEVDHSVHSRLPECEHCVTLRRYAGMALTNLTFGSSHNKALLCSFMDFMKCLVVQLKSHSEELRQVTACVLRNLSWRPDSSSKVILREVGSVAALMSAAMISQKESTLKSILSALWNLSAHCSTNKADICSVEGALGFLVDMLSYKSPSKTLTITETVGGIFRNISNHIAVREDYRLILRQHNCLQILLQHLKSPSLTIVSNACGTLWNLSARCSEDQKTLWEMGAVPMLRSLNHSKHLMIATGSRAALKNLLSSKPCYNLLTHVDSTSREMGLPTLPTLNARKIRALVKDLQSNLSETCDNMEPVSPTSREPPYSADEVTEKTSAAKPWQFNYGDSNDNIGDDNNQICNAFSSLNINDDPNIKVEYASQNYGSASLPYPNKHSFIPVRNKFSDCSYEDENTEQPVDYSQKYSPDDSKEITVKTEKTDCEFVYGTNNINKSSPVYGDYAETDLDQPTDYSLRYAENDEDSEENCKNPERFYEQDTVKTYCTEGTPYETPYNFSTATSMSDLRIDAVLEEKPKEIQQVAESDGPSKETVKDEKAPEKKSCFSSGLMSPEKPVNYCTEGTPRYFSRVSSFSSLNSGEDKLPEIKDEKNESQSSDNAEKAAEFVETKSEKQADREAAKVVTFGQVVDYAEETPLMFSRSSSLSSLNSAEQHSIHDDRSSIISDHSRLTSGIISPSELPDSPTQTVPPSPRTRKAPVDFPLPNQEPPSTVQKSVFEDNVVKYKEVNTPVDFSTNTSLSSLTIDDEPNAATLAMLHNHIQKRMETPKKEPDNSEKSSPEIDKQLADVTLNANELPPVSEGEEDGEEDMLAACINIGMQNNRHRENMQTIPKQRSSGLPKYQTKAATTPRTGIPIKCNYKSPESRLPLPENRAKTAEINLDTVRTYCTEDTPAMLSHAGSHSDLSILSITSQSKTNGENMEKPDFSDESSNLSGDNDSMLAECIQSGMPKAKKQIVPPKTVNPKRNLRKEAIGAPGPQKSVNIQQKLLKNDPFVAAKDEVEKFAVEDSPFNFSLRSSLSDLTVDGCTVGIQKKACNKGATEKDESHGAHSLSVYKSEFSKDSDGSCMKDGACSKQGEEPSLSRNGSLSSLSVDSFGSAENAEQALLEQCISSGMPKSKSNSKAAADPANTKTRNTECDNSKNVYAASVVTSTPKRETVQYPSPARTAGVESSASPSTEHNASNSIDGNLHTGETKNGYDAMDKCSDLLDVSGNASPESSDSEAARFKKAQNRMLDPDAMIESLDRFTAELVSQSSHLQHSQADCKLLNLSHSGNEGDTWNEDTSPNDVSFPSISLPLPASFKSDAADNLDSLHSPKKLNSEKEGEESNNFSSINTTTMTDSTLIAMEATKIANVVQTEGAMVQSVSSVASLELDQVKPPSMMDSLISMSSSFDRPKNLDVLKNSPTPSRKKSLPAGLMVRRALSNTNHQTKSLESLTDNVSVSSSCNLDHVKPPSVMGDYLDMVDMENSMISVASITSEIADPIKTDFLTNGPVSKEMLDMAKPLANWIFSTSHNQSSISDIENINPPSLLNEITDMCNSTADVVSDVYSETEVFEDCNTFVAEEITEYSDANSATPVQSDFASSSAESTPKRTRNMSKHLTPKQKRQLIKERYKTYTVAAEMVIREEQKLQSERSEARTPESTTEYVTAPIQCDSSATSASARLTPKERRQSDRARFQTRVIDLNNTSSDADSNVSDGFSSPNMSGLDFQRCMRQRRLENKDRFRTRTLSEDAKDSAETSPVPERKGVATYDLHMMLEHEANKVLDKLKQTSKYDDFIDCETLSLVSNEDEIEHNSVSSVNYRTYHKSWSVNKNLPVIQSNADAITAITANQTIVQVAEPPEPEDEETNSKLPKPKIVKPDPEPAITTASQETPEEPKAVRGKRKPLYASPKKQVPTIQKKPIKTVTSNLVKNVTSTLKFNAPAKSPVKQINAKPPVNQKPKPANGVNPPSKLSRPTVQSEPPKLERQGTFTKEETSAKTKVSRIARAIIGKGSATAKSIPKLQAPSASQNGRTIVRPVSCSSADKIKKLSEPKSRFYSRSPSAERDVSKGRANIHGSTSSQSLQNAETTKPSAINKRSSIPNITQRSSSNVSINSADSKKKQVTSKIASLWKKVEDSKKTQPPKKDTRVWISSTKETASKIAPPTQVKLREKKAAAATSADDAPKRISRLGSFILVEDGGDKAGQKNGISVS